MLRRAEKSAVKLDLATANVLIVGDRANEQDILAQMLIGFGVLAIQRRASAAEAMRLAETEVFDLSLIDGEMKGVDGYQLVSDFRRHPKDSVSHLPIIVICGHMRKSDVFKARDCGANFVMTKPVAPQVLFDRMVWLTRDQRSFVNCENYVGPDRRTKAFGPPPGIAGRRSGDLSEHVGEAKEANLSQDAIDGFFGAKKVAV